MTTVAPRAAATREALLEAAREVFAEGGFEQASIAEVVRRAGASVGSLYHHFGGKGDLYLALFEAHASRLEARAAEHVRRARVAGEHDPVALFLVGARAYLDGCWTDRDLARLFLAGGGPPGFDLAARKRYREWASLNANLLRVREDEPWGDALVLVLTSIMREAGHEVAVCDDEARAAQLVEQVLALVARVGRP